MSATKSNPKLWQRVKDELTNCGKTPWNARIAQRAVQLYKSRGGKFSGTPKSKTHLHKWTEEKWDYVQLSRGKGSRYLPKKVRDNMTIAERRRESARKSRATRRGKPRAKYSPAIATKMRKAGIF